MAAKDDALSMSTRILPSELKSLFCERLSLSKPTQVQSKAWPLLIQRKNAVVVAPTGSGKTLTYLLPTIVNKNKIEKNDNKVYAPMCLILAPTRELAQQISSVCKKLEKPMCIVGGVSRETQIENMRAMHCDILIATPGRLIDLVETENLTLRDVSTLVVDEADRMIDIGLVDQVKKIHDWCNRSDRQTVLLSASMAEKADFIDTIVPKPREELYLDADTVRDVHVGISSHITQTVHVCATHKKTKKLMKFIRKLNKEDSGKRHKTSILIFCNTKKTVGFVNTFLRKQNERVCALHGDMTQSLRSNAISEFKSGKKRILVSTDVAARGLDIPRLEIVVNWDMPSRLEQYVHRVGRTGRNGASGRSFTFFTRNFAFLAPDLVELLRRHNQEIDPNLLNLAENAPEMFEKEKKKKKRKRSDNTNDKDLSFKDKCWLAGSQGGSGATKKNPKKRRRGKRGGKKHSKKKSSRKVIPI
eukprot:g795.t1